VNAKQAVGDAKALILTVDQLRPATGRLQFTIQPEGFAFKKVPYAGGKNVKGQGHAHVYAKADGARKAKYIGWTGSGTTSWTDKKMLKRGTTYRVRVRAISESGLSEASTPLRDGVPRERPAPVPLATLARVQGTATVWAEGDVPESQAALLRPGARVTATSPAAPGQTIGATGHLGYERSAAILCDACNALAEHFDN
jgi:hypothetical protein